MFGSRGSMAMTTAGLFHHTPHRLALPAAARQSLVSSSRPIPKASPSPLLALRSRFSTSTVRPRPLFTGNPLLSSSSRSLRQPFFTPHNHQHLLRQTRSLSLPTFPRFIPERYKWTGFFVRFVVSTFFGVIAIGGIILLHDSLTYSERHVDRVPAHGLALNPRVGGPKNLPIIERDLADQEDEFTAALVNKPHLVIVGGGWGAVGVLKDLPVGQYNVTLISPDNFNLFTPLLPSACVGTVEPRTLVEPLRKIIARVRGHYMTGWAVDVDMSERLLEVEVFKDNDGGKMRCYVPYDKLIIAVGSSTNTHGVPGLEHCFQLKTIPDAQAIRRRIMTNLELASLPTTTPVERKKLLSFVVCGGGPTGVEFAAELADMMSEDVLSYFPKLLRSEMSVKVIQSRDHILNTYSEKISEFAEKRFERQDIEVVKNARVKEVFTDKVIVTLKDPKDKDSKPVEREIPAGFVLWSTGIAMNPFVRTLVNKLPNQSHKKAIVVDEHLRVKGSPLGTVYCIGDAATVETNLVDHLVELFDDFDTDKDSKLSYQEWEKMAKTIKKNYPLAGAQFTKVKEIFQAYDTDKDNVITLNECAQAFYEIGRKVTSLPATAQVAAQQGTYLGKKFSSLSKHLKALEANEMPDQPDEAYAKPFSYNHLGSLAYVGNSAVFDFGGYSFAGGLVAMYAWRSVYWSEQSSVRTKVLLMIDWIKRGIFGRDLSKF